MKRAKENRRVWILLSALILSATVGHWYSAYHLYNPNLNRPMQLSGDEIVYIALGDRLIREGKYNTKGLEQTLPFDRKRVQVPVYLEAPLFKHPPLYPFMVGLSRFLLRGVPGASFLPSLLMGAVSLLGLFWLARELGFTPLQSLLSVLLLAVSPIHWICSSRVWLDATLMTFIVLAIAAQLRAQKNPKWWIWMGVFWGCAFLTKYTAFAAWLFVFGASVLVDQSLLKKRRFWQGHAIALALFLPWLICRFWFEGTAVVVFWKSNIEDWKSVTQRMRLLWVLPFTVALGSIWIWCSRRKWYSEGMGSPWILVLGTFAFLFMALSIEELNFRTIPWSGWGRNELCVSGRNFYLSRQILFEPICWWGLLGLLAVPSEFKWTVIRAAWIGLFVFLTCWGNFQSRYALPLLPFEHLLAIGFLIPLFKHAKGKEARLTRVLIVGWVLYSCARSLWIVNGMAINNQFFYF